MKVVLGFFVEFALLLTYARMGYFIWRARHGPLGDNVTGKPDTKSRRIKTKAMKLMLTIILHLLYSGYPTR